MFSQSTSKTPPPSTPNKHPVEDAVAEAIAQREAVEKATTGQLKKLQEQKKRPVSESPISPRKKRGSYKKRTIISWEEYPFAPPLSKPIEYLNNRLDGLRLYYKTEPTNIDWQTVRATDLKKIYPPIPGYGDMRPPQCLILEAATSKDQLVVVNWWALLTKEQQLKEYQNLRNIYAVPRSSTRKLTPEYFEKISKYEQKQADKRREEAETLLEGAEALRRATAAAAARAAAGSQHCPTVASPHQAPLKDGERTPRPPIFREENCHGWKGSKYDALFHLCFLHEMQKRTSMASGAAPTPECFPIRPDFSKAKGMDQLQFVKERNEYVLRSISCNRRMPQERYLKSHLCESCATWTSLVAELRLRTTTPSKKMNVSARAQELKEEVSNLKGQLREKRKREAKLKEQMAALKDKAAGLKKQLVKHERREKRREAKLHRAAAKDHKEEEEEETTDDDDEKAANGEAIASPRADTDQYTQLYRVLAHNAQSRYFLYG